MLRARIAIKQGRPQLTFGRPTVMRVVEVTESEGDEVDQAIAQTRNAIRAGIDQPLFFADLVVGSKGNTSLVIAVHHLIADLTALLSVFRDLQAVYETPEGESCTLDPGAKAYASFVAWQEQLLEGSTGAELASYWKRKIRQPVAVLEVHRAMGKRQGVAAVRQFDLPLLIVKGMREFAKRIGCTSHAVFLSALAVVLRKYSGQNRFLLGIIASGRTLPEFKNVVGYFANVLPIEVDCGATECFSEVLAHISHDLIGALDHEDFPFANIIQQSGSGRDIDQQTAVPVLSSWYTAAAGEDNLAGVMISNNGCSYKVGDLMLHSQPCQSRNTQCDVFLSCLETADSITCQCEYDRGCCSEQMIDGMVANLMGVLQTAIQEPSMRIGEIPLEYSERNVAEVVKANSTGGSVDTICIHKKLQASAEKYPSAVAIVHRDQSITFQTLASRTNQLAHYLAGLGIGPESRVGVFIKRSIPAVLGIWGTLNSGAAYVPLDPGQPDSRLEQVIGQAGLTAIVTLKEEVSRLSKLSRTKTVCLDTGEIDAQPRTAFQDKAEPQNLAYVMFTSGSTGSPKGVMIEHQNLSNFCAGMDAKLGWTETECLLAVTNVGFDISILELLWTLTRGMRVVIADDIGVPRSSVAPARRPPLALSLFYFADSASIVDADRYRLCEKELVRR